MQDNNVIQLDKFRKLNSTPLVSTPASAKRARAIEDRLERTLAKMKHDH